MGILCSLRLVDLVKNIRIWIVFSHGDVKGFHTRLRPNQRQVLAECLNEFRLTLWLNLCFDKHDCLFIPHIRLLLSIVIAACSPFASPAQPAVPLRLEVALMTSGY